MSVRDGCARLVVAIASLAPDSLLDGELCIFDQQLISRFEWLRERFRALDSGFGLGGRTFPRLASSIFYSQSSVL